MSERSGQAREAKETRLTKTEAKVGKLLVRGVAQTSTCPTHAHTKRPFARIVARSVILHDVARPRVPGSKARQATLVRADPKPSPDEAKERRITTRVVRIGNASFVVATILREAAQRSGAT